MAVGDCIHVGPHRSSEVLVRQRLPTALADTHDRSNLFGERTVLSIKHDRSSSSECEIRERDATHLCSRDPFTSPTCITIEFDAETEQTTGLGEIDAERPSGPVVVENDGSK
jgi:hypothetical protein